MTSHEHEFGQWTFVEYDTRVIHVYAVQARRCQSCGYQVWDRQVVK